MKSTKQHLEEAIKFADFAYHEAVSKTANIDSAVSQARLFSESVQLYFFNKALSITLKTDIGLSRYINGSVPLTGHLKESFVNNAMSKVRGLSQILNSGSEPMVLLSILFKFCTISVEAEGDKTSLVISPRQGYHGSELIIDTTDFFDRKQLQAVMDKDTYSSEAGLIAVLGAVMIYDIHVNEIYNFIDHALPVTALFIEQTIQGMLSDVDLKLNGNTIVVKYKNVEVIPIEMDVTPELWFNLSQNPTHRVKLLKSLCMEDIKIFYRLLAVSILM